MRNRDQLLVVPCGTLNHYIKSIDRFSIETHGDLGIHHQMVIMGFIKKNIHYHGFHCYHGKLWIMKTHDDPQSIG